MVRAEGKDVGDETHALLRWEDIGSSSDVLFQNVILNGAFEVSHVRPLLFGCNDVHR